MAEHDKESLMPHESFLSRWSERKLNRSDERDAIASSPREEELSPSSKTSEQGKRESTELPSIDSLDENSDYSAFFSPDVNEELQRLALRKLFSNHRFNVRDGLDDYDEDYRSFESLGNIITAEMRHHMVREQEKNATPSSNNDQTGPGLRNDEISRMDDEQDEPALPDSPSTDSG